MAAKIFIDGEVGTTGLQIRSRLEGRDDVEIISLASESRKDAAARAGMLNDADLSILCLPDEAAREAVAMIENPDTKVIDASTAHRVADGWVYGFPELGPGQAANIADAKRVTNPGCYALSSISMLYPLVTAGLLPADYPVTLNAVSGYSGGGRKMIESFEDEKSPDHTEDAFRVYGLGLEHKHVAEIQARGALKKRPLFMPSIGRFSQGMIVQLPLQLWSLPGNPSPADIHAALAAHYKDCPFVSVAALADTAAMTGLQPEALNGTNELRLHVFANAERGQAVIATLLDNLGKGASGQAVQNMNLMLGLPETAGL
ncbi:MAG: N-acetyl-gamma-glutamyl-phosphate reductase [Rhodospirillales bacterium]|nr:N-acetyl-gamma-glutamyl-phosphate reductase [Rhodospirillales bacterium]